MIRHQIHPHPDQLRIDTTIKIIAKDGTETIAPVVVIVGLTKVDNYQQSNIYRIANSIFNKEFVLDRRNKPSKKPWYQFWKAK
jgi:hypothetical protein